MAEWWRSWHGAPTDPKWRVIAKRAKVPTSSVVAVAWTIFDRASQADDRGSIEGVDPETLADFLDIDTDDVLRILRAMQDKSILDGARVTSWDRRQPKREREDDSSADRTRKYRERMKNSAERHNNGDASERHVTPCDASERHVTPRGEERREEKKEEDSAAADPTTRVSEAAAAPASPDFHDQVLEAAGVDVSKDVRGKWHSSAQQWAARAWLDDLSLTEAEVLAEIRTKVAAMPRPPGTLKFFNPIMAEAAGRKSAPRLVPIAPNARASPPAGAALDAYYDRVIAEYSKPGA